MSTPEERFGEVWNNPRDANALISSDSEVARDSACFCMAAELAELSVVKKFVNCGVDIDGEDSDGRSALYYALDQGRLEICLYLIKSGSNPNLDGVGQAALDFPEESDGERVKVLKQLLKAGMNPKADLGPIKGLSLVRLAEENGDSEALLVFQEHKG